MAGEITIDMMPALEAGIAIELGEKLKIEGQNGHVVGEMRYIAYNALMRSSSRTKGARIPIDGPQYYRENYEHAVSYDPTIPERGRETRQRQDRITELLHLGKSRTENAIWFHPRFIIPSLCGLAIWADRLTDPEAKTPLCAHARILEPMTEDGMRNLMGAMKITKLVCIPAEDNQTSIETAEKRACAAIGFAARWGLASSTALRFGYTALYAEGYRDRAKSRHWSSNVIREHKTEVQPGKSPYVVLEG